MKRIVPGLLLAAFWLFLLLWGSFFSYWAVILLVAFVGAYEYLKMTIGRRFGVADRCVLSLILVLPVVLVGLFQMNGLSGGLFLSFFLTVLYIIFGYRRFTDPFLLFSQLAFGAVYTGFLAAHLVLLWLLPEGNYWLIILVAITAGSDSGAYYSGRLFGKHLLCPSVSPKKTVEGAVGGVICGVLVAVIFSYLLLRTVNLTMLLPVSVVLVGAGMLGDLCESVVKRGTNTKDSGKILLGHGGILDRIDSLLLAAPFLYYLHVFTG